jgi:anti-anti-sigma regulatory factor
MQSMDQLFDARIVPLGPLVALRCTGELCLYTADLMIEAGERLAARTEEIRMLDLQRVSFIDLAGLRSVVDVLMAATQTGPMPSVVTGRALRLLAGLLGLPIRARIVPGSVIAQLSWRVPPEPARDYPLAPATLVPAR